MSKQLLNKFRKQLRQKHIQEIMYNIRLTIEEYHHHEYRALKQQPMEVQFIDESLRNSYSFSQRSKESTIASIVYQSQRASNAQVQQWRNDIQFKMEGNFQWAEVNRRVGKWGRLLVQVGEIDYYLIAREMNINEMVYLIEVCLEGNFKGKHLINSCITILSKVTYRLIPIYHKQGELPQLLKYVLNQAEVIFHSLNQSLQHSLSSGQAGALTEYINQKMSFLEAQGLLQYEQVIVMNIDYLRFVITQITLPMSQEEQIARMSNLKSFIMLYINYQLEVQHPLHLNVLEDFWKFAEQHIRMDICFEAKLILMELVGIFLEIFYLVVETQETKLLDLDTVRQAVDHLFHSCLYCKRKNDPKLQTAALCLILRYLPVCRTSLLPELSSYCMQVIFRSQETDSDEELMALQVLDRLHDLKWFSSHDLEAYYQIRGGRNSQEYFWGYLIQRWK